MAYWEIKNVAVRGVTGTVPNNPVKSADFPFYRRRQTRSTTQSASKTAISHRKTSVLLICALTQLKGLLKVSAGRKKA